MALHRLKIIKKRWFTKSIFGLEFRLPGIRPLPGQFFQVQVDEGVDPFLNRPISIASYVNARLLLVVKVVGRGTRMLGTKEPGEFVKMLGPFGRRFTPSKKKSLIIAGGIGIAPLHFLAEYLFGRKIGFDVLYGVRTKDEFIFTDELVKMSERSFFVAEKGCRKKETVVSKIQKMGLGDYGAAYTCGPRDMFIALQRLNLPMPIYAFCEDFMGCGCGLCLGCAVMYKNEYHRICTDGPVLELGELIFEV
jgi:dihydroorotate dehydrogenase electron transfer subunit